MKLYPYQKKIFDQAIDNFRNINHQMIVIPTGGGKTVVFMHIIKALNKKTLVVAHTKEIISQARDTARKMGIENCDFMTIQSCGISLKRQTLKDYEFLIIDECHRCLAETYNRLTSRFKKSKILGVTATPFRTDGKHLSDIFNIKLDSLSLTDMIEKELLCDIEGYRIKTGVSLKDVKHNKKDFSIASLSSVVNVSNRNEIIVREYQKICPLDKTLCFCVDISHCHSLHEEFKKNSIPSAVIIGEMNPNVRKQILTDFKDGKIRVLINCQVLTEGFDEPSITCLLMCRPTKSKVLFTQMIGRGMRLFPGKSLCKVLEFTDNDFDVSSMEELVSSECKSITYNFGEKLSSYYQRSKKQLLENTGSILIEKIDLIKRPKTFGIATEWQISHLSSLGKKVPPDISEIEANKMIEEAYSGSY